MNVLVVNPFGIGDCLFATPLIRTLKEKFPHSALGFLCNRRSATLLKNNPFIDEIIIYERDDFKQALSISSLNWSDAFISFIRQIKRSKFDLAVDLSLSTNFGFFLWLAGVKKRIGYSYKNRGFYLTDSIKLSGYEERHIVEYYNALLELIGIEPRYKNIELYLKNSDKAYADDIFKNYNIDTFHPVITIAPGGGASWGIDAKIKRWPRENFRLLTDKIIEKYNATVIILGDLSEAGLFSGEGANNRIINLIGRTTLLQSAALIEKSDLFVGNDGGPLHMAVALGKKTVSFFGPVDPTVYGPYLPEPGRHIVLRRTLECSPCYRRFRLGTCVRNRECLEKIEVEEAIKAIDTLL
jgi:lipopolysaccharide heptosyltransferase II